LLVSAGIPRWPAPDHTQPPGSATTFSVPGRQGNRILAFAFFASFFAIVTFSDVARSEYGCYQLEAMYDRE
jgi:hypothetical protein